MRNVDHYQWSMEVWILESWTLEFVSPEPADLGSGVLEREQ